MRQHGVAGRLHLLVGHRAELTGKPFAEGNKWRHHLLSRRVVTRIANFDHQHRPTNIVEYELRLDARFIRQSLIELHIEMQKVTGLVETVKQIAAVDRRIERV